MTNAETSLGLRQASLALSDYDPRWAEAFEQEAATIRNALSGLRFEIDHIGSTSVPGLSAKPILDIALRATEEAQIAQALTGIGYIDRGMRSGRLFIRLRDVDVRTHNLHLYQPGDPDCLDQITFRDVLRTHAELRARYAKLKHDLVAGLGDQGRGQYADGKTDFVRSVVGRNR